MESTSNGLSDASPEGGVEEAGREIVVHTEPGESHVGLAVCQGPGLMRLLVTRPYNNQGQIVEIPIPEIASISPVPETTQ